MPGKLREFARRFASRAAFFLPGGGTLRPALHRWRGARIGRRTWISQFVYLDELHPEALAIGDDCTIGLRTSIFTHFYWGGRRKDGGSANVVIEDRVFIGPHCVILPGVTIGKGSVIVAGTTVSRDVPPHTLWGPAPAGPLARVTVSLAPPAGYQDFVHGLRPLRPPTSPPR